MAEKKSIPFEASARLQRLIGRDLIPNEPMAVVELVKNAYDSGAQSVQIFVQRETTREPSFIRISDDGEGMSEDDVERLFMVAGYSERPDQVGSSKRIPTGEKGIGRFAADKLGQTLEVFTAKQPKSGIHLSIDWREFEKDAKKKFSDISATYEIEDVSKVLNGKSGTVLRIERLRNTWNQSQVDDLITWLGDLLNPFAKPKDFAIELEVGGSRRGSIRIDPVPPKGDVLMEISVVNNRVHKTIREREAKKPFDDEPTGSSADLQALKGLRAKFVHFDKRPKKEETQGTLPGVRVYRDGFRIEPFGSPKSDWLGVAEKRAKRAGHAHVVPNRLFGFVEISRKKHPQLSDTTSRQALLDTDAAKNLVTLLGEALKSLNEVLRQRTEPRWRENRRKQQAELELARLHVLGAVAAGLAHELRQPLQIIRAEADNIREKLKLLGIEDSDVSEAQRAIDRGIDRINKNIGLVSSLSKGNLEDLSEVDLVEVLKGEVDLFSNLCAPHGINISLRAPSSQTATTNQAAVSTIVTNFIQNSMHSIQDAGGNSIVISLRKRGRYNRIEVEDDGGGIPDDVAPHLFKKFATNKTGGFGYGLNYCKLLVDSLNGKIGYEQKKKGAVFWVEL